MTIVDVSTPIGAGRARLTVTDLGGGEYQVSITTPDLTFVTKRSTPDEAITAGEQWLSDAGQPLLATLLATRARAELHR